MPLYLPKHQAQLVAGVPTASVDCGVRATSVAIDRATRGVKAPKVAVVRTRGGMGVTATNVYEWEQAVTSYDTPAELNDKFERITAERIVAGDWSRVADFVETNEAVVLAVDYGILRRSAPRQTGSESFNGFHAITIVGNKWDQPGKWRDYDSLNDGRYAGCPKGWVWMQKDKLREAALAVGRKVTGTDSVYALLVNPADKIGQIEIPPAEDDISSLGAILADLVEFRDGLTDPDRIDEIQGIITDLYEALGLTDLPPAETIVPGDGLEI